MNLELTNGSILVRPYREEDTEALYEAARESIAEVSPWLPWCHPEYSRDETIAFIRSREEGWKSKTDYSFGIWDTGVSTYLGGVGLNQINSIHQIANLGYWIRSSAAGQGIATIGARLVARFGFEHLGFQRIEIITAVANKSSQRVAEKVGAIREGFQRKRLLIHGHSQDALVFSLVAEDIEKWPN